MKGVKFLVRKFEECAEKEWRAVFGVEGGGVGWDGEGGVGGGAKVGDSINVFDEPISVL